METVNYELKSKPGVFVKVPVDYACKAESLVTLAIENPTGLAESVSEHPYLENQGILSRTQQLAVTHPKIPESLRLQDEVYLRVCIYGNDQKMRGPERQEALEIDGGLFWAVENLL